jgi:hypothetical protein
LALITCFFTLKNAETHFWVCNLFCFVFFLTFFKIKDTEERKKKNERYYVWNDVWVTGFFFFFFFLKKIWEEKRRVELGWERFQTFVFLFCFFFLQKLFLNIKSPISPYNPKQTLRVCLFWHKIFSKKCFSYVFGAWYDRKTIVK